MKPYYQDKWVTIYHGDCREILPQLDVKVDLVLTDPPYFLPAYHHATRKGSSKSWGNLSILEHFFNDAFRDCQLLLNDMGWMYCFCDGQSYPIFYRAAYSYFKSIRPIIWDKVISINGYWWRHQHEIIMFATQENTLHEPTGDGDIMRARAVPIEERIHDAEKPLAIIEQLISKGNPQTILDPFLGSGTTCFCAKKLNRHSIGIEIEEKYCEIAARRCSQEVMELVA